tara:strand:+ start:110 stop:469 length:360 start_codon:yes stop_codon:yes gene_type:complete
VKKINRWNMIGNIKEILKMQKSMDRSMSYPYMSVHNYETGFTDFIKIPNDISRDSDSLQSWLSKKYKLSHIQYMECKGISMDDVTDFRNAINNDEEYNVDVERESKIRNGIQCTTDCED